MKMMNTNQQRKLIYSLKWHFDYNSVQNDSLCCVLFDAPQVQVKDDDDEGDAVTYSAINNSSWSAGVSVDHDYATVNKPNKVTSNIITLVHESDDK